MQTDAFSKLKLIPHNRYVYTQCAEASVYQELLKIPGATLSKGNLIGFPHNTLTVQWLMYLGFSNIPHPIDNPNVFVPMGKFKPLDYQLQTARYITSYKNSWILSKMWSGKTASSIWASELLRTTGEIKKVIICCPISTIDRVWVKEIFQLYPMRSVGVVTGSSGKKVAILQRDYDYYIINHDGLKLPYIRDEILKLKPSLLILDEATAMKNPSSARFKSLKTICKEVPDCRLWAITATPTPNGPDDMWALQTIIDPRTIPATMKAWKNTTMWQVDRFKWVPKKEAPEIVKKAMFPAILFARDDIPDIGKPVEYNAPLTKVQQDLFNRVKDEMVAKYKADKDHTILAVNAAVKLSKLLQICSGNVYDINQNNVLLENKERLAILTQVLEQIGAKNNTKAIVFVPFKNAQHQIHKYLNTNGYHSELVNGDTVKSKRSEIFRKFEDEDDIRVLIAHPKVAAHGLTLIRASTIIWYGPHFSLELYEQGNGRIARLGQKQKLQLVHVGSHNIEWEVYKTLQNKGDNQNAILKLYEQVITTNT
jgi:SNF2 family DNA or RNA helicase